MFAYCFGFSYARSRHHLSTQYLNRHHLSTQYVNAKASRCDVQQQRKSGGIDQADRHGHGQFSVGIDQEAAMFQSSTQESAIRLRPFCVKTLETPLVGWLALATGAVCDLTK